MLTELITDQIVKYIYQETSAIEREEVEDVLSEEIELQEDLFELLTLKQEIDSAVYAPSQNCIDNILNFSKSVDIEREIY